MSILKYFDRIDEKNDKLELKPFFKNKKKKNGNDSDSDSSYECTNDQCIKETHIAFTDGSCFDNGSKKAIGGIGVFFNDDNSDNISESLQIENGNVTNNKCELEAVRRAIITITERPNFHYEDFIKIYSDSKYLIDSITKWSNTWAKNGWMRKNRGGKKVKVKNVELIKEIKCLYVKYNVQLIHCKAHTTFSGDKDSNEYKIWYGNKRADELAVEGSKSN